LENDDLNPESTYKISTLNCRIQSHINRSLKNGCLTIAVNALEHSDRYLSGCGVVRCGFTNMFINRTQIQYSVLNRTQIDDKDLSDWLDGSPAT
jgi:hypothetical protein